MAESYQFRVTIDRPDESLAEVVTAPPSVRNQSASFLAQDHGSAPFEGCWLSRSYGQSIESVQSRGTGR